MDYKVNDLISYLFSKLEDEPLEQCMKMYKVLSYVVPNEKISLKLEAICALLEQLKSEISNTKNLLNEE
jgi:hypothetical protein